MNGEKRQEWLSDRQAWMVIGAILIVGVVLRLNHLLGQRPFWYDELILLLNLMERTYAGLREPLAEWLVAPYAFMVVLKWFGETFGFTELGVRLPVTIASLAALPLFYFVFRRFVDRATLIVALLLFATSSGLVYYAAEMKQYSFDVLATLLVYCFALPLLREWRHLTFISLSVVGMIVVWFSHPVAFVLGGVGLVLMWQCVSQKQYSRAVALALVSALWIASFATQLWFTSGLETEPVHNQRNLYWIDYFMPFPPGSVAEVMWYWTAFVELFKRPFGFEMTGLAALAACAGVWSLWRRSFELLAMLVLPILITLLVSGLHLLSVYGSPAPFHGSRHTPPDRRGHRFVRYGHVAKSEVHHRCRYLFADVPRACPSTQQFDRGAALPA